MAKPKKGVTPKALKPYLFKAGKNKVTAKKRTKKAKKKRKGDTRFGVIFG
jgi:hypothetical protein